MEENLLEYAAQPRGQKWVVVINNKRYVAEYLTEEGQMARGMAGRKSLDGCMVFRTGPGSHKFWMKDCLIPLDIVFVINNRINKIYPNCPPDNKLFPTKYIGYGDHVIEFPGGTAASNFKVGDVVGMFKDTNVQKPTVKDQLLHSWNGKDISDWRTDVKK